jgi:hypothetical protein
MKIADMRKTLVVFLAQSGPIIVHRLDQLPVEPAIGAYYNFEGEYYQQVMHAITCFGRTANGARRSPNRMLFETLTVFHTQTEVAELLQRRFAIYTVDKKAPQSSTSSIIIADERLDETAENLVIVHCKRMPTPGSVVTA